MRAFRILLRHELSQLLLAPSTYITAVLFLVVMGFLYMGMVSSFIDAAQEAPPASVFFRFFVIPLLFMAPLLTMRSVAEERRSGTLECLLTAPVPPGAVILSKFLASYLLYCGLWATTFLFHLLLHRQIQDPRLLDAGTFLSGYLFLFSTGAACIALGILASALSSTQLVAALASFACLFVLLVGSTLGIRNLRESGRLPVLLDWLEGVDIAGQADGFFRGFIDLRPIGLHIGATLLLLFVATLVTAARAGQR